MMKKYILIVAIGSATLISSDNQIIALHSLKNLRRTQSAPALIQFSHFPFTENINPTEINEVVMSPVTISNRGTQGHSCHLSTVKTAIIVHQQLDELEEIHTTSDKNFFSFKFAGCATATLTGAYYIYKTKNHVRQKFNIDIPLAPIVIAACTIGTIAYIRNWLNKDAFKALDHIDEAQEHYNNTIQELKVIHNRLKLIEETNKTLWQRLAPCEKTMEEIIKNIQNIKALSSDHTNLAEISSLTIQLCKMNARRLNDLVYRCIPSSEQNNYLINFSDESIAQAESSESNEEHQLMAIVETHTTQESLTQARQAALNQYRTKHPLKAALLNITEYGKIPLEWRQKHFPDLEQGVSDAH